MPAQMPVVVYKNGNRLEFPTRDAARQKLQVAYTTLTKILDDGKVHNGISRAAPAHPQAPLTVSLPDLSQAPDFSEHLQETILIGSADGPVTESVDAFMASLVNCSGEALTIIRDADGFVDATLLCQRGGRRFDTWHRVRGQAAISATIRWLEKRGAAGTVEGDVVQINNGGVDQHTWVHPLIGVNIATWVSPDFGVAVADLTLRYTEGKLTAAESMAAAAAVQAASVPFHPQQNPQIQGSVHLNPEQSAIISFGYQQLDLRKACLPFTKQEDAQLIARQEALVRIEEREATALERGATALERRAGAKRREADSTMSCLAAKRQEILTYPAQEEHARVMQGRASPIDPIPPGMFTFSQLIHSTAGELGLFQKASADFRAFICGRHRGGQSGYDIISTEAGMGRAAGGYLNTHVGRRMVYHRMSDGQNVYRAAAEAMKRLWLTGKAV